MQKNIEKNYFDHEADIGIIAHGKTLESCFCDAACVMFSLSANLSEVHPTKTFKIEFEENDIELALVTWLNLLLAIANTHNFIFSKFHLHHHQNHWEGEAAGEPWQEHFERGIDVKGATLTMLSVKQINVGWEARCVVDV